MAAHGRPLVLLTAAIVAVLLAAPAGAAPAGDAPPSARDHVVAFSEVVEDAVEDAPEITDTAKIDARTGEPGVDDLPSMKKALQTTIAFDGDQFALLEALESAAPDDWTVFSPGVDYYATAQGSLALMLLELDGRLRCDDAFVSVGYYAFGQGGNEFAPNPDYPYGSGVDANSAGAVNCIDEETVPSFALPDETGASQQATSPLVSGVIPTKLDTSLVFFLLPFPVEWTASLSGIEGISTTDPATAEVLEWASSDVGFLIDPTYRFEHRPSVSDQPGTGLVVLNAPTGEVVEGDGSLLGDLGEPAATDDGDDGEQTATDQDGTDQDGTEQAGGGADGTDRDDTSNSDAIENDTIGDGADRATNAWWFFGGGLVLGLVVLVALSKKIGWDIFGPLRGLGGDGTTGVDPNDPDTWVPVDEDLQQEATELFTRVAALASERADGAVVGGHVVPSADLWDEVLADPGVDAGTYHRLAPLLAFAAGHDVPTALPGYGATVSKPGSDGRIAITWKGRLEDEMGREHTMHWDHRVTVVRDGRLAIDPTTGEARWCPEEAWNRIGAAGDPEAGEAMMSSSEGDGVVPS